MKGRLTVAILAAGLQAFAGQKEPRAAKPPAQARPNPGRGAAAKADGPAANAGQAPGIENVKRLAEMSPQERQKALAALPPERRQALVKRLQNFQQMPQADRQRAEFELRRLQQLPPLKRNQVRRSIQQFTEMPEERKAAISSEIDRLGAMPEDERRARMNSEEFRNRYSPAEQQMMSNISEVLPQQEPQITPARP